jgi:ParB family chromosome partitioning protein
MSEYRLIPLDDIHESKHNPRRHVDVPALEQLAESIRKVGVIMPALVRPNANGFELAAGHRRYRAAKLAGLERLPCLVREMTDQVLLEVLTIENLQRENVHPLDEAKGYEALMAAPYTMKVEVIAARVGKSEKYIYDRVKLLQLSQEAQELFWDGLIEAGHAILLARLTASQQAKVIGTKKLDYDDGGLFVSEHRLYDTDDESESDLHSARENCG